MFRTARLTISALIFWPSIASSVSPTLLKVVPHITDLAAVDYEDAGKAGAAKIGALQVRVKGDEHCSCVVL